jgi:hypothetical protein
MSRHQVQFHWKNQHASTGQPFGDFDDFLAALTQDKRKKIRQERRKVAAAGVTFRWARGADITPADWVFFYRCYERTYLEHGNDPYLTPAFFQAMARDMAEHWVLFIAEREAADCLQFDSCRRRSDAGQRLKTPKSWPTAATGARCSGWTACTSRPAITSPSTGASATAWRASRAARRASTRWRAPCCRCRPPAPTGWPTRPLPTRWRAFWRARTRDGAYLHELRARSPLRHDDAS